VYEKKLTEVESKDEPKTTAEFIKGASGERKAWVSAYTGVGKGGKSGPGVTWGSQKEDCAKEEKNARNRREVAEFRNLAIHA